MNGRLTAEKPCAICGLTHGKRWTHHYFQRDERDAQGRYFDRGRLGVCGACSSNPPEGWVRL